MARFKLLEAGVKDTENDRHIPEDTGNRDWQEYQEWLAEGNEPDPEFTPEELAAREARRDAIAAKLAQEETVKDTQVLKAFMRAGPDGIDNYIDANVTNIASAKTVLKMLAKIVWSIGWRTYDNDG